MSKYWLTSSDLASLVVCPESFRLKKNQEVSHSAVNSDLKTTNREVRERWSDQQLLLASFRKYGRMMLGLLFVLLGLAAFGELLLDKDELRWAISSGEQGGSMVAGVPVDLFVLLIILGTSTMLWDLFERKGRAISKETGLDPLISKLRSEKLNVTPSKELISELLMLKSRPHAFINEGKLQLPIDIHPSTDKVRDRHVVQLLTHLRILSENSKTTLPHGYLLMGPKSRLVKIAYDEGRQVWIEELCVQAEEILRSNSADALPEKYKCRGCDVRDSCSFKFAGD